MLKALKNGRDKEADLSKQWHFHLEFIYLAGTLYAATYHKEVS